MKIVSPQYVKPFVRRQKTDSNDAEAICTAARQAHMRFVPRKTVEQQDIQALHRARQRLVGHRTAVVNQIRGLLLDRGIVFPKSITRARRMIPGILEDADNELTDLAREAIGELHCLFRDLDRRIASFDKKIDRVFRSSDACQRIARIKGVGPMTATAIVAAIGDGTEVQERASPGCLGRARPPPAFQRPAYRLDGHLQAWQSAPENPACARCPRGRAERVEKNGPVQCLGQPASSAAWFQPGHGCRRQQERTDYLGRASKWRGVPRCALKAHLTVARRWRNECHRSDRRATSLTNTRAFEAYQV